VLADPFVQLRLLDLQDLDTVLNQLAHRRTSLPELATIADCEARAAQVRGQLVDAQTEVADLDGEQRRMEADIDTVRQRADRDQQRMDSGGVAAKELTGLQHEIASLARRQGVLEDVLLELMERRETAEGAVKQHSTALEAIMADKAAAEAARDQQFGEIDDNLAERGAERADVSGALPADLLKLYEKARESGGKGAALLRGRRCEACRLELAGSELSAVRSAKPEEVVRCDNCRAILIRTAESGL